MATTVPSENSYETYCIYNGLGSNIIKNEYALNDYWEMSKTKCT